MEISPGSTGQSGSRRGLLFAIGAAGTAFFSFGSQILFERGLGVDGFARWVLANALLTFFVPLASFGATNLILSEYYGGHLKSAAGRRALVRYLARCTTVAGVAFVLAYALIPFAIEVDGWDVVVGLSLLLAQVPIVLVYPVFQIQERHVLVAFWPFAQNFNRFLVALVCTVIALTSTLAMVMWLATIALLLAFIITQKSWKFYTEEHEPDLAVSSSGTEGPEGLPRRGFWFGMSEIVDTLDLKIAIPLAALFLEPRQVAAVALGVLFLNAVHYFPYVLVMRYLLPLVHRRGDGHLTQLHAELRHFNVMAVIVLVPGVLLFVVFGADLLALIAEGDYRSESAMFLPLGLAMIPLCFSILEMAPFLTAQHARRLVRWRIEAGFIFLVAFVALVNSMQVAAVFFAVLACRSYLYLRALTFRVVP